MLAIRLNGEERQTAAETLVQLLRQLDIEPGAPGFAIAINGAVVPRSDWEVHPLEDGDRVEVVGAVQGG